MCLPNFKEILAWAHPASLLECTHCGLPQESLPARCFHCWTKRLGAHPCLHLRAALTHHAALQMTARDLSGTTPHRDASTHSSRGGGSPTVRGADQPAAAHPFPDPELQNCYLCARRIPNPWNRVCTNHARCRTCQRPACTHCRLRGDMLEDTAHWTWFRCDTCHALAKCTDSLCFLCLLNHPNTSVPAIASLGSGDGHICDCPARGLHNLCQIACHNGGITTEGCDIYASLSMLRVPMGRTAPHWSSGYRI